MDTRMMISHLLTDIKCLSHHLYNFFTCSVLFESVVLRVKLLVNFQMSLRNFASAVMEPFFGSPQIPHPYYMLGQNGIQ